MVDKTSKIREKINIGHNSTLGEVDTSRGPIQMFFIPFELSERIQKIGTKNRAQGASIQML